MLNQIKSLIKARVLRSVGLTYNSAGVPYLLAKHLNGECNIVMIDIGAHTGNFTEAIERFCGISRAILFEPQPDHAALLRRNFSNPRFKVHECVVSATSGKKCLEINEFDATSSIFPALRNSPDLAAINIQRRKRVECQSTTLDKALVEEDLREIDLVKIDVQGAELEVLAGGIQTLTLTKFAWIEVSFKPLYEGACLFEEVYAAMSRQGFQLVELDPGFRSPTGELLQADALFMKT